MMTNAKKPISAAVTAIIAMRRAAPRPLRKSTRLFKTKRPSDAQIRLGNYCLWDGFDMVNEGKYRARTTHEKSAPRTEADFREIKLD
jgi:hypothetical protein